MDAYEFFKQECRCCPYGFHDGINCAADDCVVIEDYLQRHFNELRARFGNPHGFKGTVTCKASAIVEAIH